MTPPNNLGGFRRITRRLWAIGTWIAEREDLSRTVPEPLPRRSALNDAGWLIDRDSLPFIPQRAEGHGRFFSWLIASERLPVATFDHEPGAGSLLRWFFTADQPAVTQKPEPTKEASSDEP